MPIGADQFECITIIEHWIAIFGPTHRPITISWKHPQHGRARHTQLVDSLRHTSSIIGYSPSKIRAPDEGLEPTTLELKVWRPTSWATQACWISLACSHSQSTAPLLYMQISDRPHAGSNPCPDLISWPRGAIQPPKERSGCRGGNHVNYMREKFKQTGAKQWAKSNNF